MKSISYTLLIVLLLNSCSNSKGPYPTPRDYPPYGLIVSFSETIKPETGLRLSGYGINNGLPKGHQHINGIGSFCASYTLAKTRTDIISLQEARNLLVFVAEGLLKEINSNQEVRPELDVYPFVSDLIDITIRFKDENQIDLGQGVAVVYFWKGEIEYEGYRIDEYTGRYPASGKHFTIHKETYAEALEIVKKQDSSMH